MILISKSFSRTDPSPPAGGEGSQGIIPRTLVRLWKFDSIEIPRQLCCEVVYSPMADLTDSTDLTDLPTLTGLTKNFLIFAPIFDNDSNTSNIEHL